MQYRHPTITERDKGRRLPARMGSMGPTHRGQHRSGQDSMDTMRSRHRRERPRCMHAYRAALTRCQPDSRATIIPRIPKRSRNRKHGARKASPPIHTGALSKRRMQYEIHMHSVHHMITAFAETSGLCMRLRSCCNDNFIQIGPFDPVITGDGKSKR